MTSKKRYSIDEDTGVDHADEGPWRNYQLCAEGNTREDLMADAWVFEIDQDGGELRGYPLEKARSDVQAAAERMIDSETRGEGSNRKETQHGFTQAGG